MKHCCDDMKRAAESKCGEHKLRSDCPDALITYVRTLRRYGIIVHDGGTSSVTINYCPWCGTRFPKSS